MDVGNFIFEKRVQFRYVLWEKRESRKVRLWTWLRCSYTFITSLEKNNFKHHEIYFDRFFTTVPLVSDLKKTLYSCGTLQKIRQFLLLESVHRMWYLPQSVIKNEKSTAKNEPLLLAKKNRKTNSGLQIESTWECENCNVCLCITCFDA